MAGEIRVPAALRRKVEAEGETCRRWLENLPVLIDEVSRQWDVVIGDPMEGGTASFVAAANLADGSPAVVKLAMPASIDGWESLERSAATLTAADGRGCVRPLAYDPACHALLLEGLGPPLSESPLALEGRLRIITTALQQLWLTPTMEELPQLSAKARWLASFIADTWESLGKPCPKRVVDHALLLAERRFAACRQERDFVLHGDAHAWNTLEHLLAGSGYRLIDPDPLNGEPEYDLAISMREYDDELLVGDPVTLGRKRALLLSQWTGTDPQRIWEWGYIERVSTALLLIKLDNFPDAGRRSLEIAGAWAQA